MIELSEYRKQYKKSIRSRVIDTRIDSVSKYLDLTENQSVASKDFCINHSNRILSLLRENESNLVYVQEGLIKTYPVRKLIDAYRTWFKVNVAEDLQDIRLSDIVEKHLATKEIEHFYETKLIEISDISDYFGKDKSIVTFYIPFHSKEEHKNLLTSICDSLYVCGYNLASNEIITFDPQFVKNTDIKLMYVTFEPKFSDLDFKFSKYLYHIAPFEIIHKIQRNGLVPSSKHSFFKYPERVYLFNNCKMNIIIDYGISKCEQVNSNKFVLLKIDSQKLQNSDEFKTGKLKFYIDQKYPVIDNEYPIAIYTYGSIRRNLLEDEVIVFEIKNKVITKKENKLLSELISQGKIKNL